MGIEVTGLDRVKQMVANYTESMRTMKPLFEKIEEELETIVQESIAQQKSATTGQKFEYLSEVTVEKTGRSKNKALYSPRRIVKIDSSTDNQMIVSISMPFAEIHQYGNPDNKYYNSDAPIPRRPFLPITTKGKFTKEFENKLSQITQEWLTQQINKRR